MTTEAYDTDAYGNTLCYSGPGTDGLWFTNDDVTTHNPINTTIFTGRLYDPESQIYYYRARYYSPNIGRFISRDLAGAGAGINLYEYVRSNAVNRIDPTGLMGVSPKCAEIIGTESYADGNGWQPRGAGYVLVGGVSAGAFTTEYTQAKGLWTAQVTVACRCCNNQTATGTRNYDSDFVELSYPIFLNNPLNLPVNPSTSLREAFISWLLDKAASDLPVTSSNKNDSQNALGAVSSTKPNSASAGSWLNGDPCT